MYHDRKVFKHPLHNANLPCRACVLLEVWVLAQGVRVIVLQEGGLGDCPLWAVKLDANSETSG